MKFWTDSTWQLIHMYCFLEKKKKNVIDLLHALAKALPCVHCSKHMLLYLDKYPPQESSLFQWSIDFHNNVNARTNKPMITYEQAKNVYLNQIKKNTGCYKTLSNKPIIFITIVFVILLLIVYNKEWIKNKLSKIRN